MNNEKVDLKILEQIVNHVKVIQGEWCNQPDGCAEFDATFASSHIQQAAIAQELIMLRKLVDDLAGVLAYRTRGIHLTDISRLDNPDEVLNRYRKYKDG